MAKQKSKQQKSIRTYDYLRKSTKGIVDGRERQEKSIQQQRKELDKLPFPRELADAGFEEIEVVATHTDEGVSGWKMGNKRPGFQAMIEAIEADPAKEIVIRVDDIDRFSRADVDETQEVARRLKKAGVRWIVSSSKVFDLGRSGNDIGEILQFVIAAWSSHEYSNKLGRRVALAKRNAAAAGKRTGGKAPFGFANDGAGGLVHGDPEHVETVRLIFDPFVNQHKGFNRIASTLNEKGTPSPSGRKWNRPGISRILRRRAYRGDHEFGQRACGRFYRVDDAGEVVESSGKEPHTGPVIEKKGVHEPIVDPKLFDAAQKRLASFKDGRRKPHGSRNGKEHYVRYPLAGILICDHCGAPLYGCQPRGNSKGVTYRCSTPARRGPGSCGYYQLQEDEMLPFVLETLSKEIHGLSAYSSLPPGDVFDPAAASVERQADMQKRSDQIKLKLDRAVEACMEAPDARTRKMMDAKIADLWQQHDVIEAELQTEQSSKVDLWTPEHLNALADWYAAFMQRSVYVPSGIHESTISNTMSFKRAFGDDRPHGFNVDTVAVNETLHELGAEVRLRWKTETVKTRTGKDRKRHTLHKGRLRLGQQTKEVACSVTHASA